MKINNCGKGNIDSYIGDDGCTTENEKINKATFDETIYPQCFLS